ncbi:Putative peptidase M10, metallopeptidase [Desulfamplus magnetovallimortis]|uniref:Putative peptidase M10, metallopeptidase n=1 Tax=Desulfamplus magnetovallimortis TaxID=1246637 RepID=L0R6M2_9BACT|nr:matrixin family metalloprotease [Desulfamplus magnetovallimortis]CCO06651.1 Putative peptidase M10, metallopeptidase [Desulfamplus magnetovallimortis BW-1]SLM32702.1 Putative peptidase M10, metallopeptidase [Desulfamplus magnetovallimortis]
MPFSFFRVNILFIVFFILSLPNMACTNSVNVPHKSYQKAMHNPKILELPVSVYLLDFAGEKKLNSRYSHGDVKRLFEEVNYIWLKWNIKWNIESIESITIGKERFKFPDNGFKKRREFRNAVARVIPDSMDKNRWRVYFVDQFPVNGSAVYIAEKRAVLYGELNKHGERHPVILAHEFGHSLGLQHVKFKNNLMYAGPGKDPERSQNLMPWQIKSAREQAILGPAWHELNKDEY